MITRRLVDVAQDAVVTKYDCGTLDGVEMTALEEGGEIIERMGERVLGRVALEDILDLYFGDIDGDLAEEFFSIAERFGFSDEAMARLRGAISDADLRRAASLFHEHGIEFALPKSEFRMISESQ